MITEQISGNIIKEGDSALVWFSDDVTYMIEVSSGQKLSIHCGKPIPHQDLIGKSYGQWIECGTERAIVLSPTVEDLVMKARRESGIIYPKDAAMILMKLGIRSGSRVLEVGTGSGSLTTALASQVAPGGKIISYDVREDFQKLAERNLKRAKLLDYVELKKREGHEPFEDREMDAIVTDTPEPWHEVENIKLSLKNGGRIAALNPTYNQNEKKAEALGNSGFFIIEAMEILVRGILARPGKTRPEQRMVSHTEFILFAVKPASI